MGLIDALGGRRVYLDANVFVYAVEEAAPFADALRLLFDAVRRGAVRAITSELTLAETLVVPIREGDRDRQRAFARAIRQRGGLAVMPVTRAVLVEAARLRAALPALKLPDAIHAATARLSGCGVLLTNDTGFGAVPGVEVVRLSEVVGG